MCGNFHFITCMAKAEIVELLNDIGLFIVKSIPLAFAALSTTVIRYTALYLNGDKVSAWKMFVSGILAIFIGTWAGYLCQGMGKNAPLIASAASGIVGRDVVVWVIMNHKRIMSGIFDVIIGRLGGKNKNTEE